MGRRVFWSLAAVVGVACGSTASPSAPVEELRADAGTAAADAATSARDASATNEASAPNTDVGKCVDSFADALTAGFGRVDGTLVAIVRPVDQQCAMPNRDHVILEVDTKGGIVRLVANVLGDDRTADKRVRFGTREAPLPDPPFEKGWHTGKAFDYTSIGAHADSGFEPYEMDALVPKVVGELKIGANISVYATSGAGRPESAHLIHRVDGATDGAIVVSPDTSPKWLLFHFAQQTF